MANAFVRRLTPTFAASLFLLGMSLMGQTPPSAPAKPPDDLHQTRIRFRYLSARADALEDFVKSLADDLSESGLHLHPNILAARSRMESFLSDVDNDIKAGKKADAEEDMRHAEAAVARLEHLTGAR